MIARIAASLRRWRKKVSRSEWAAKHIEGAKRAKDGGPEPGIILIQIDGLGYDQFLRALRRRRLPFITKFLTGDDHELHRFYSGLPSTTPAVQSELFFGVRCAVPAFHYIDRAEGNDRVMYDPEAVNKLAASLEESEVGLLTGGTGYGNILVGGAEEARFCIQGMDLQSIFGMRHPFRTLLLVLGHLDSIFRICGLAMLETLLAVVDFFRGLINRRDIFKELRFIASRIGVCIVMRELLRLHVKLDIADGVPIIHATFVGYDEHAHRRGPSSAFAHWTLKGIDGVVRDIVRTAHRSDRRQYQIVIYSDHGQEAVLPFAKMRGESLFQSVSRVFNQGPLVNCPVRSPEEGVPYANLHLRAVSLLKKVVWQNGEEERKSPDREIRLTAMGPLGHLYLPQTLTAAQMDNYAGDLVRDGKIPYVLYNSDRPWMMTGKGKLDLRQVQSHFEKDGHFFAEQIQEDLLRICLHQDAGDFVIGGWRQGEQPLTFPVENGAHGGPGRHETCGFLIIPDFLAANVACWRPAVLRKRIMAYRQAGAPQQAVPYSRPSRAGRLRLLTYNIHSCIGLDGKMLPERIGRIIGRLAPDLVCLQEVDRKTARSGGRDQAEELASSLGMEYVFLPLRRIGSGEYGIAVLSRVPFKVIKSAPYAVSGRGRAEKRGAIWLEATGENGPLYLVNTHFGLTGRERRRQLECLLGAEWLAGRTDGMPLIVCGDFNAGLRSPVYRQLAAQLHDVRSRAGQSLPATFSSIRPLLHLDHIFYSGHFKVAETLVRRSTDCRLASDHLPLFAELERRGGGEQ